LEDENGVLFKEDSNDYYPFGLNFINPPGLIAQLYNPSATYRNFKYQEQELQETGFYAFKWRNYDPSTGRFLM
jgi:RHS repeat-associated protein